MAGSCGFFRAAIRVGFIRGNCRLFRWQEPPPPGSSGQKPRNAVVTCTCEYHMYIRLSHVHVTKTGKLTPDDVGEGGGGTPFIKKAGAAGIFAGLHATLGGVTQLRHLTPLTKEACIESYIITNSK